MSKNDRDISTMVDIKKRLKDKRGFHFRFKKFDCVLRKILHREQIETSDFSMIRGNIQDIKSGLYVEGYVLKEEGTRKRVSYRRRRR